jgi:hypothetical protein
VAGLVEIGDHVVAFWSSLAWVNPGETQIERIPPYRFNGGPGARTVALESSLDALDDFPFSNCTRLGMRLISHSEVCARLAIPYSPQFLRCSAFAA